MSLKNINTRSSPKSPSSFVTIEEKIKSQKNLSLESKSLLNLLIEAMKTMLNERDNKVCELADRLEEEIVDKESKINALNTEIQNFKSVNTDLASQLKKMTNAHDELEAYGRLDSLVFSGDKIKVYQPDEDCVSIAKNMINSELKLAMDPIISSAHRMGRPPAPESTEPDKRSIIVKFVKRDDKFKVLKKATNKSTRVSGLYVNESLTPTRAKILYVLRQCKKNRNSPLKGTSTLNGRVFAVHKASATSSDDDPMLRTEINTKENLQDFVQNFLKESLESFLDSEGRRVLA